MISTKYQYKISLRGKNQYNNVIVVLYITFIVSFCIVFADNTGMKIKFGCELPHS